MNWIHNAIQQPSEKHLNNAQRRQSELTKPAGSLGALEAIAIRLAALQQRDKPSLDNAFITIFAADHGIAAEGVSAFPQAVTKAMLSNFVAGGAAINVLSKCHNAHLDVVNVGVIDCNTDFSGVTHQSIAEGTANFALQAAMTPQQLTQALDVGKQTIDRISLKQADVFIGGEMGIANTTSASAIACALLRLPVKKLVGPGTGLSQQGIHKKQRVIELALKKHHQQLSNPLEILQTVGGFEIAALVGAYIRCGQVGIPVIVDGFISTVAALIAVTLQPTLPDWLFYSHQSEEAGHQHVLAALKVYPLLKLNMRLGEASGAAVALPILRSACQLHNHMATFAEAGI
jgi:nicotinate-nucleotide--dimethylbenzimidazole phosphoribosyltransferase